MCELLSFYAIPKQECSVRDGSPIKRYVKRFNYGCNIRDVLFDRVHVVKRKMRLIYRNVRKAVCRVEYKMGREVFGNRLTHLNGLLRSQRIRQDHNIERNSFFRHSYSELIVYVNTCTGICQP